MFEVAGTSGGPSRFVLAYTVIWEALGGAELTFWVLTDRAPFRGQIREFRRQTTIGLLGAAMVFVVIQLAAVRWGLAPVRRMASRLRGLEAGRLSPRTVGTRPQPEPFHRLRDGEP